MTTSTVSRETLVWWTTDDGRRTTDDGRRTTDDAVSELDVLESALMDLRSGRQAPFVAPLDTEDLPSFERYEDEIGYDESRYPWRY